MFVLTYVYNGIITHKLTHSIPLSSPGICCAFFYFLFNRVELLPKKGKQTGAEHYQQNNNWLSQYKSWHGIENKTEMLYKYNYNLIVN